MVLKNTLYSLNNEKQKYKSNNARFFSTIPNIITRLQIDWM